MKKTILFVFCIFYSPLISSQIIADHTVVDKYDQIPQQYIDAVKKMWATNPGESHSAALRQGLLDLEAFDPRFSVSIVTSGTPEPYTTTNLRFSGATRGDYTYTDRWQYDYGEEDWFTNLTAISRTKAGITYCNTHNLELAAIGFGWCYDDSHTSNISATADPVYGCRWYGRSYNGPEGNKSWGLDAGDQTITGNSVCLDTYLSATQEYVDYCAAQGYKTKVYFTTGPVEPTYYKNEAGYQASLKHRRIRDYVNEDPTRILFDYADILCYDNGSTVMATSTWNGHTFPVITPTNYGTGDLGHIDAIGALRLAKAMWWMLARIAGWDGGQGAVAVENITVTGAGGFTTIAQDNGTLAFTATVAPSNATNKTVTWSIVNGTGQATINSTGLVTAIDNGTVTARATANDGSGIVGSLVITITGQTILVSGITVTGAGGATTITQDNGTLALTATVAPSNATNKTVTWSITSGSAYATINATSGLLTAVDNGTVTIRATATDVSGVYGTRNITISGQTTPVSSITVSGQGGATSITTDGATLQMVATILPSNATNKTVNWSVTSGSAYATINPSSGVLTAVDNGTVTVRATATDGSGVNGTRNITISGQTTPVSGITVAGQGGATSINTDGATLQMVATVLPSNATNKTVNWSVTSGSAYATINPSSGVLTAIDNGTVTVRATATDGSGVNGTRNITISGQTTPVSSITVAGQGGATSITFDGATLQMAAMVLPANATNKTVTWSITSGSAYASINATSGLLTAVDNGTVTVRATAADGSNVSGSTNITISGQTIPVNSITVSGSGGVSVISSIGGTLQLTATVLPANATNRNVTWSITNGTGQATISSSGLVTAVAYGTVIARASALDGSGSSGTMQITIANQVVPVTGITLSGGTSINTDGGTLQLSANVTPSNATVKTVTWSISEGRDKATISSNGLVTAIDNGSITVKATANDGSGVFGTLTISISNQVIPVTGISISGGSTISTPGGTLQLAANITPANASNKSVTWSITGGTGLATIDQNGLISASANGTLIIRASANDGSNVYGTTNISISNQVILVKSIVVTASKGSLTIVGIGANLQLYADVSPANTSNKSVVWAVINGTGQATISSTGLLTSIAPGTITAKASATDGSGVSGTILLTIVNNIVNVSNISVIGSDGVSTINTLEETLQLNAEVLPAEATDKTVTWSLINGSGRATINSSGLVTAVETGTVTATATANDGSGISGSMQIEIYTDPNESLLPYVNGLLLKVPLSRRFAGKKISLYDIYGRLLAAEIAESDLHEFDISKYHPGLYLIVLTDEFVLKVNKVVLP